MDSHRATALLDLASNGERELTKAELHEIAEMLVNYNILKANIATYLYSIDHTLQTCKNEPEIKGKAVCQLLKDEAKGWRLYEKSQSPN